jgi:predicted RNase H-like HicB family nuclease
MFLANDPHDLSQVDVFLESNRAGRTIAHVPELPGCVVRGETPQEAAGSILDAVAQHLDWLGAHRGRALRLPQNAQLRVVGTVPGGAPTGSGSRGALLPTDTIPVGATERMEHLKRMKSSRADLLEIVSRVPAELLVFRPTPRQRTIREILQHVADAERVYLARLFKLSRFPTQPTALDRLRIVRQAVYKLLPRCNLSRGNRKVIVYGEPWTLRKVLRRFLDHEREHILEIECRLHLKRLPFAPSWMNRAVRERELRLMKGFQFR